MNRLRLFVRLALREMGPGLGRLRVFVAAVFLGIFAIASVGVVTDSLFAGLRDNASAYLGGDVEVNQNNAPLSEGLSAFLERSSARRSQVVELRAMVGAGGARAESGAEGSMGRGPDRAGAQRFLVELKAVDGSYPLVGEVGLSEGETRRFSKAVSQGAVVDADVLRRLGIGVGDAIVIGEWSTRVTAVLTNEPDQALGFFKLGPRVMISTEHLRFTGLIQPGSLALYRQRLLLPSGVSFSDWRRRYEQQHFGDTPKLVSADESSPMFRRFLHRIRHMLTLVGLTALLIGILGMANSVRSYVQGRRGVLATLRSLGASRAFVGGVFATVVSVVGLGAALLAVGLSSVLPWALQWVFTDLGVDPKPGWYGGAMVMALGYATLTIAVSALWPLSAVVRARPAQVLRDSVGLEPDGARPSRWAVLLSLVCGGGVGVMTYLDSRQPHLTLGFLLATVVSLLVFWGVTSALVRAMAAWTARTGPVLRMALRGLVRRRTLVRTFVVSLGLSFTVLITLALVQGSLDREISENLSRRAPAFILMDIQKYQQGPVSRMLGAHLSSDVKLVPFLRGRLVKVAGRDLSEVKVDERGRWATEGDLAISYADEVPDGAKLVKGQWWSKGEGAKISLNEELARYLGVDVGDTLTFAVLGREMRGTIANLRKIDWWNMRVNFSTIFSSGGLDQAPHTYLASVFAKGKSALDLERQLGRDAPNVSVVRMDEALSEARTLLDSMLQAIRFAALFTLLVGIVVVLGAIATLQKQRTYESVLLKVLGARRGAIVRGVVLEYGVMVSCTLVVSCAMAPVAAWAVVTQFMKSRWVWDVTSLVATAFCCGVLTLGWVLAFSWKSLSGRAIQFLRND